MTALHRGRALVLAAGLLGSMALVGCTQGQGPVVTEMRDVRPFTRLEVGSGIEVVLTVGEPDGLAVRAQQNVLPIVATEVRGDTLTVEARDDFSTSRPVTVTVATPALDSVSMSGGARLTLEQLDGESLELDLRGGSQVTASGSTAQVSLVADGGAVANLGNLVADTVQVTLGGGAIASVNAAGHVMGSASAGSTLSVAGGGTLDVATSGGASVGRAADS